MREERSAFRVQCSVDGAHKSSRSYIVLLLALLFAVSASAQVDENKWEISAPILSRGSEGSFNEVSVKDPTIVFHDGKWHLFFTARSKTESTTGYVSARTLTGLSSAKRHQLDVIRGKNSRYGCAPQVFYYEPQKKWYMIFQNRDSNYQPAFSTAATVDDPAAWSKPEDLLPKKEKAKWIDFWVISDEEKVYLFYTQAQRAVIVRSTRFDDFPAGWSEGKKVLTDNREAVHVYKVKGREKYHMIYELNNAGVRSFAMATATALEGPWKKVTTRYATGDQLVTVSGVEPWTEMVSHGELLRTGYDQRMEYDPATCRWLIQGIMKNQMGVKYPFLPWKLGLMSLQK